MKKYLTTPIYYVNDVPHIGHAYCTLATDTLARYWRMKLGKENVFFLTGVDENSQKTVDAAKQSGKPIPEYLDAMAKTWQETWEQTGVAFDDFIRTTEDRHQKTVHSILSKIHDKGDIYKGKYEGKYCTGCEAFLKDSDLDEKGECPAHKKKPDVIQEDNYFFKLSAYENQLLKLYKESPVFLLPESRKNEVVSFITSGLDDVSISRENGEVGIPLPWDEHHKVYVWFDALLNYYSAIDTDDRRALWKSATHIIGKDITRFHCVIWPAMLLSAGIDPAKEVFAHGFFTVNGEKMSKSLGNVISPLELSEKYGNDALRLGLLGSFEFGNDGDFSLEHFDDFYRTKLAGGVGNLFNRVIVLIHKFLDGEKPAGSAFVNGEMKTFEGLMEQNKLKTAIDHYFSVVSSANELLNETQVWTMAKTDLEGAKKVFATLLQKLELLAQMAEVLLPQTAPKMKAMLGDEKKVGAAEILFARQ
jgi:methionyl-tRNA synthetase